MLMTDWRLEQVRTENDGEALLYTVVSAEGKETRRLQLSAGELAGTGRPQERAARRDAGGAEG